jgi:phosphopantetheinyl transferase (holo-ACP synthase)
LGDNRVKVAIGDYCEATMVVAATYPEAPGPDTEPLRNARPAPHGAADLYAQHLLFHGPKYQGIIDSGVIGADGIRGTIEVGPARGALLDNAGQLFGYWFMATHEVNSMAMPVGIERMRFFGRAPGPGERIECTVRIRAIDERSVTADLNLARGGRAWTCIEGWRDFRFETDDRLWAVVRWPEKNLLSDTTADGFVVYADRYQTAPTRERLVRRFLTERERAEYEKTAPQCQRAWINGRIAGKDAVRHLLGQAGHGPIFPAEVVLSEAPNGCTLVKVQRNQDVRVSIASLGDVAVALAAENRSIGIGLERIEQNSETAAVAFTEAELALVREHFATDARARVVAAKQAAAKAKGASLSAAPGSWTVGECSEDRLLIGDVWVETRRHGDCIIAWTKS